MRELQHEIEQPEVVIGQATLEPRIEDGSLKSSSHKRVDWRTLTTVEAVCEAYPGEVDGLLKALDLQRTGLEAVKAAAARSDRVTAANALLRYYRESDSGAWLRHPTLEPSEAIVSRAEAVLANKLTFYDQTDTVPTTSSGGIDWHHSGPTGDWEWALALNRHFLLDWLLEGNLATTHDLFTDKIDALLRDWFVASYPYPARKNVDEIWRGLEVSFRAKVWASVFYGLIDSEKLQPGTRLLMLASLLHHAHHLRHFHAEGNWITMELSALATIAAAWPEFADAGPWMDYATQTLTAELSGQVYPDGAQTELSSSYHVVAIKNFQELADVCRAAEEPLPAAYASCLKRMINYLADVLRPDGTIPLNSDSDRADMRAFVRQQAASLDCHAWLYIVSNGTEGEKPPGPPSRFFAWAGQLISRNGWEADAHWSFFDLGPWGTYHQHNDKLHLSVTAYGRDLLVDSGRFAYTGKIAQTYGSSYARHSRGHNVVLIDGQGQGAGPHNTLQPMTQKDAVIHEAYDYATGGFDQFEQLEGKAEHRRVVFYIRGACWLVIDRIATDRPRHLTALWHFAPDCNLLTDGLDVATNDAGTGNLRLVSAGDVDWTLALVEGQEEPHPQGWYSKSYNQVEPAATAIFSGNIGQTAVFAWLIVPAKGTPPTAALQLAAVTEDTVSVTLTIDGKETALTLPFEGPPAVSIDRTLRDFNQSRAEQSEPRCEEIRPYRMEMTVPSAMPVL